jgi:hypothetical protein
MAELDAAKATTADPCCASEQQASCCEPSAKADCCGHEDGCSCAAGSDARTDAGGQVRRVSEAHEPWMTAGEPRDDQTA